MPMEAYARMIYLLYYPYFYPFYNLVPPRVNIKTDYCAVYKFPGKKNQFYHHQ